MLENFDDICFSQYGSYDFVVIADKYLDSVKTDTPVSSITFVRSFNFEITSDGSNDIPLLEHAVVDINYKESTWGNEVPEIVGVGYWIDGKRKGLDYIDVDARKLGRQNRVHH